MLNVQNNLSLYFNFLAPKFIISKIGYIFYFHFTVKLLDFHSN